MSIITKSLVLSRVHFHISRVFKSGNEFEKGLSKFLTGVLEEEYQHIQSLLNKIYDSDTDRTVISSRKVRKLSEYVLFCRYMKEHHPDQLRLQSVWQNLSDRVNWQKSVQQQQSKDIKLQSSNIQDATDQSLQTHKKFILKPVMDELMRVSELDDHLTTLYHIRLEKSIQRNLNYQHS